MGESKASGMFEAGSAVLRGVIAAPLERVRRRAAAAEIDPADTVNTIIESQIIPRLLMAHSTSEPRSRSRRQRSITAEEASRFALLPLRLEAASLLEEVDAFVAKGATVETICLDLLAPAARSPVDLADMQMPYSALFSPMPGDHHNFGVIMIEEVFARSGWRSEALVKPERRELLDRLARQPFDLVGLTLARDCPSVALGNLIRAVRNVSANPNIIVLVGGRMINENPEIAIEVGADGTGADALAALEIANNLVKTAAARALNLS